MKKVFRYAGKLLIIIFAGLVIWSVFNFSLVIYGFGQLRGQLEIVSGARLFSEVLADTSVPDSVKEKIKFIGEVTRFAIDSLGLKESKNYTTYFDQKGQPLLWVLTAAEPYELKAFEWKFPLLGSVSYKGFFDMEKGVSEEREMVSRGYDTDFGVVSAWSTLGWFRDPVLSGMLRRSRGDLAELIIHEMTHATIYLKSNVDLNENLASACGEAGAIRFLTYRYGSGSNELTDYIHRLEDYESFSRHMLSGSQKLDSLYKTMNDLHVIIKKRKKEILIREIIAALDTVSFHNKKRYKDIFDGTLPDNAYFLNFVRYDLKKNEMKSLLNGKFKGDMRGFIGSFRGYPE